MHVCFICSEYPPAPHGGTGSSYRDLSEGLVAAGHQATVVGVYKPQHGGGTEEKLNGVRIVRLNHSPNWLRYKLGALSDRYRISRWLARENQKTSFDVIEASDYGGWLRFGGPKGVPTVVRIRGSNYFFDTELKRTGNTFEHNLEREALARADVIGSVSRYAAKQTLDICKLSHRPCTILYNAVDTELFSPSDTVKTEAGLIVFVNYINPKKGIEQLIDAMNIVCRSHPEAKLAAIGQDAQKPEKGQTYLEKIQQRIRPEFRNRIIFTGRLERYKGVVEYLRRAHICCYPSHMETFGIAPLEAMSVGKPTIFSQTGPGPEIIEDGISGLLCDPYSPEDIAVKIMFLLKDRSLAKMLAANARQRVETLFSKKDWIHRNIEFYNDVISRKGARE
jgi:glycosyltransferase involved in cell wall biosynthesis